MRPDFTAWCVIGTRHGFKVEDVEVGRDDIGSADIIAVHPNRKSAEDGMYRAILLVEQACAKYGPIFCHQHETRGRAADVSSPGWTASIDHEIAVRNKILAAVHEASRPRDGGEPLSGVFGEVKSPTE